MAETRKLAAILVSDVVGYSRLAGTDEDRILARLRALRSDLIDPIIAVHNGRVVKRTGDGAIVEFRSVVDAVRCAIEVQNGMVERNAGLPPERRIQFRIGIHLGDVVEESDGDLMGDGVNIAARLEGIAEPGSICLSEDAYRQVRVYPKRRRTRQILSVTRCRRTLSFTPYHRKWRVRCRKHVPIRFSSRKVITPSYSSVQTIAGSLTLFTRRVQRPCCERCPPDRYALLSSRKRA
jgi:class 3 adenylate cyclase